MGDIAYAQEKLRATVTSLADSEGALRDRLLNSYMGQGERTPVVDGGRWYPDLADRIKALHARLTGPLLVHVALELGERGHRREEEPALTARGVRAGQRPGEDPPCGSRPSR